MEFVGYYYDGKSMRYEGIKNVSGRAQAKKVLSNYLKRKGLKKFKILYVLLPDELPRTLWNKIHDQHMRMTDLHSATTMYKGLLGQAISREEASRLATKTFSQLPKRYQDVMTSYYLRIYFFTSGGKLVKAIDGDIYRILGA